MFDRHLRAASMLVLALPLIATAQAPITLRDLDGKEQRPFADPGVKAVVLVFVLPDCPIANSYVAEIKRLCNDYTSRGVRFYVVHVEPELTDADARQHAREYGYTCGIVLDRTHRLARLAGVRRVPEAAVFVPSGERKYVGRIDDLYIAPGKRRSEPTSRDLRDALGAVLAGRTVARPETEAVGCYLPPLPKTSQER